MGEEAGSEGALLATQRVSGPRASLGIQSDTQLASWKLKMLRSCGCRPRLMSWREGTPGQMPDAEIQVTAGVPATCQDVPVMAPAGSHRRIGDATNEVPFQPAARRESEWVVGPPEEERRRMVPGGGSPSWARKRARSSMATLKEKTGFKEE